MKLSARPKGAKAHSPRRCLGLWACWAYSPSGFLQFTTFPSVRFTFDFTFAPAKRFPKNRFLIHTLMDIFHSRLPAWYGRKPYLLRISYTGTFSLSQTSKAKLRLCRGEKRCMKMNICLQYRQQSTGIRAPREAHMPVHILFYTLKRIIRPWLRRWSSR